MSVSAPIKVDVPRLKPLFQEPAPSLDIGSAVLPGTPADASAHLDDMVAKTYAKRLVTLLRDLAGLQDDDALSASVQHLLDGFVRLPRTDLLALSRRPEVTSWTWQVRAGAEQGTLGAEAATRFLQYAGTFLAPVLLRHGLLPSGSRVRVASTGPDELTLLPLGLTVGLPGGSGTELALHVEDGHVVFSGSAGDLRLDRSALLAPGAPGAHGAPGTPPHPVTRLARVAGGPVVLSRHAWWTTHFPSSAGGALDLSDEALPAFAGRLGSGLRTMDALWPEAAARVRGVVAQVMPIESQGEHGNRPFNYSVHAFRGLIMTSGRAGHLAAQTLAHETGHNRFSSMVDLFQIAHNAEESFYSPFVDAERPLINLFHGVFAFLNDVHMARRSAAAGGNGDGPAIVPYIGDVTDRLRTALDTLVKNAQVTVHGQQLLDAFQAGMPTDV